MSPCLFSESSIKLLSRYARPSNTVRHAVASYSFRYHCLQPLHASISSRSSASIAPDSHSTRTTERVGDGTQPCLPFPLSELKNAQTFKNQYLSTTRSSQKKKLSREQYSFLISFFGSLSLPKGCMLAVEDLSTPGVPDRTFSLNPIARKLSGETDLLPVTGWSFVVVLAKDKSNAGYQLTDGDNYWLMHAALHDVRRLVEQVNRDEKSLRDHLDRARTYYFNIRSQHPWRVHYTYLDTLMTLSPAFDKPTSNKLNNEVVERISTLLNWRISLHPKLLSIVWRTLLLPSNSISDKAKAKLINVLRRKLEKESLKLRRFLHDNPTQEEPIDCLPPYVDERQVAEDAGLYTVESIQDLFTEILFTPHASSKMERLSDSRPWIIWQTRLVLGPTTSTIDDKRRLEVAWSNLRLLALSSMPKAPTQETPTQEGQNTDTSYTESGAATTPGWTVICSLSAIDCVAKEGNINLDKVGIREVLRSLWVLWRRETEHALSFSMMNASSTLGPISESYITGGSHFPRADVPTSVLCSVAASFLQLAVRTEDQRLHRSVLRHVEQIIIEPAQLAGHTVSIGALKTVAVQACVAGTVLGKTHALDLEHPTERWTWSSVLEPMRSERLFPTIRNEEDSVVWMNTVANEVLLELVGYSIKGAYSLYMSSRDFGLELMEGTITAIGQAFTSAGNHELSLVCIRDARLSSDSAQQLFDLTLKGIVRSRRGFLDLHLLRSLIGVMSDARSDGTMLTLSGKPDLGRLVSLCIHARHIEEATQIVQMVQKRTSDDEPSVLRPKLVGRLVNSLLSGRRYRLLSEILTGSPLPSVPSDSSPNDSRNADVLHSKILNHPELRFVRRILSTSSQISTGAPRTKINRRLIRHSIPFSRYDWSALSRFVRFRPQLAMEDKQIISLQLSTALRSLALREKKGGEPAGIDEPELERIAAILVRMGRVSAAVKVLDTYSKKSEDGKPSISTRAGNILLGASLLPKRNRRNLRQFQHAANRLQKLVHERGFVPDRITLNILMKSLLRWESLTPIDTLRGLFEKLVQNGYSHSAFPVRFFNPSSASATDSSGTETAEEEDVLTIQTSVINKKDSKRTRHRLNIRLSPFSAYSRKVSFDLHVRPMYKMFIKAFYARGDKEAARGAIESLRILQSQAMKEKSRQAYMKIRRRRKTQTIQARADEKVPTPSSIVSDVA